MISRRNRSCCIVDSLFVLLLVFFFFFFFCCCCCRETRQLEQPEQSEQDDDNNVSLSPPTAHLSSSSPLGHASSSFLSTLSAVNQSQNLFLEQMGLMQAWRGFLTVSILRQPSLSPFPPSSSSSMLTPANGDASKNYSLPLKLIRGMAAALRNEEREAQSKRERETRERERKEKTKN